MASEDVGVFLPCRFALLLFFFLLHINIDSLYVCRSQLPGACFILSYQPHITLCVSGGIYDGLNAEASVLHLYWSGLERGSVLASGSRAVATSLRALYLTTWESNQHQEGKNKRAAAINLQARKDEGSLSRFAGLTLLTWKLCVPLLLPTLHLIQAFNNDAFHLFSAFLTLNTGPSKKYHLNDEKSTMCVTMSCKVLVA